MDLDAAQATLDAYRAEHGKAHGVVLDAKQYVVLDKELTDPVRRDKDSPFDGVPLIIRGTNEACPIGWCDLRTLR